MTTSLFLEPRLVGKRFEGHSIPLEFLRDFAALEEMVVEIAKSEYFRDHPDRKRVPKGFTEGIELRLAGVEDGSAVLKILLACSVATLFPIDGQETYFNRARDGIVGAIQAAETNKTITDYIPERTLGYFDTLGRSLRDEERIEFSVPGSKSTARLTRETRRRLVLASSTLKELTEEVTLRGSVPEADQSDMTFEIQIADGRKIRAPIAPQHFDTVIKAFDGYTAGTKIVLQGIGRLDRNERLLSFDSVEQVGLLDPRDVQARLDELRVIRSGWLDGEGEALPHDGLNWLSGAFESYFPDGLVLPHLYPTPEGNVQAEWSLGEDEITLEIDLAKRGGRWHSLNMRTKATEVKDLDLRNQDAWEWFLERIRQIGKVSA